MFDLNFSSNFSFSCCPGIAGEPKVSSPCHSYAEIMALPEFQYLAVFLEHTDTTCLFATCITLGIKKYQMMSAKQQYNALRKAIDSYLDKRNLPAFYVFELTKAGVIHAHGIEYFESEGLFRQTFKDFGSWNFKSERSYEQVTNHHRYIHYMTKDQMRNSFGDSNIDSKSKYWYQVWKPVFKYSPSLPHSLVLRITKPDSYFEAIEETVRQLDYDVEPMMEPEELVTRNAGGPGPAVEAPPEGEARNLSLHLTFE